MTHNISTQTINNQIINNDIDFKAIESTINQAHNNNINQIQNQILNNQIEIKNEIRNEIKSISIKIPSGTQIRPARRMNGTYYMTLGTNVSVTLKTKLTVNIDGTMFDVITGNSETKNNQTNIMNNKIIPIPAGTRYYINDIAIDQIGLMRVLDVNDEFHMAPGSKIVLPANTVLTLHKNTINNGTINGTNNMNNGGVPISSQSALQVPPIPPVSQTQTNNNQTNNQQTNNQTNNNTNIIRQATFTLVSETECTI